MSQTDDDTSMSQTDDDTSMSRRWRVGKWSPSILECDKLSSSHVPLLFP